MQRSKQNFLDMIPVRNVQEFTIEEDKITLLVPKFKSAWMIKWFIPQNRSKHFRIHLDPMGSKVWELIDGERNVHAICDLMNAIAQDPEQEHQNDLRTTEFLRQLFKNRFILFRKG